MSIFTKRGMSKGGINPDNTSSERPPAPGGSDGTTTSEDIHLLRSQHRQIVDAVALNINAMDEPSKGMVHLRTMQDYLRTTIGRMDDEIALSKRISQQVGAKP